MQYSTITNNIIKAAKTVTSHNESLYLLYQRAGSIFDSIMRECSNISIIENTISDEYKNSFAYNAYWSNNPLAHTEEIELTKFKQIRDIVFFHDHPNDLLKKEDKFLMQNALNKSILVCPDSSIQKAWGINSALNISYGIPVNRTENKAINKKSVLVLNTANSKQVNLLWSYIQQDFPDTYELKNIDSWDQISNLLSEYKICIVFNNSIDVLAALSCGCSVITPLKVKEKHVAIINDFTNIKDLIKQVILEYDSESAKNHSDYILEKYDFTVFDNKITSLLQQITREPFLL